MNPNQYLLIFTIGPVQSFIAQARKTRDLYAGSSLLSKLCQKAAKLACSQYEASMIFPTREQIDDESVSVSLPNRFVALVNSAEVGKKLEDCVKNEFRTSVLSSISKHGAPFAGVAPQVEDFLRVYWASLPLSGYDYNTAYNRVSGWLDAAKNTRVFKQVPSSDRKCSLCGEYAAMFLYSSEPDVEKLRQFMKRFHGEAINLKQKVSPIAMTEREGLCAICFYKRFDQTPYNEGFDSTAKIALLYSLSKLKDQKILEIYQNSLRAQNSSDKRFDEQLYFEENLTQHYLDKNGVTLQKSLHELRVDRSKIEEKIKTEGGGFCRYYALVMLDGDDMGKWVAGEWLQDKSESKNFHQHISQQLCDYAKRVRAIFDKETIGKLVYAGGDDVLAFINLACLFDTLAALFHTFPSFGEGLRKATPSCGVVVAHYKTPLSEVMKWAKRMEELAKSLTGKHAIGIALMTHSGAITQTVFRHRHLQTLQDLIAKLHTHFNDSFLFNFRQEFFKAFDNQKLNATYDNEMYVAMMLAELKRLMLRSRIDHSEQAEKSITDFVATKVQPLLIEQIQEDDSEYSLAIDNFASFFEVARFFAQNVWHPNKKA